MRVYFDNAATTPMSDEVIQEMIPFMKNHFGNPSSIHSDGRTVRAALEQARKKIANHLNASIGEIFFTSGGTESNNMALKCAVRDLGVTRIISTKLEHHCVLHTLENLEKNGGIEVCYLPVDQKGCIKLSDLDNTLGQSDKKTLVSLMHANNEIGTMINIDAVSNLCENHNAFFHSDTVQTVGHFPIDVSKTKIHFLSAGAHKFHGPKGIGFIYINNDSIIKPFIDGGSQERNMRGGTENVIGIIGMAKALDLAYEQLEERKTHINNLRLYLAKRLKEEFEDIKFNGDIDGKALYTVLNVSFPPSPKSALLIFNLDIAGISASGGSACSSGADAGSHVLAGINADAQRTSVRFSFSHYNTEEEIDFLIEKLATMVPKREGAKMELQ